MGYDAFVICTCYQEGKTKEPPHKEFLRFDHEGLYLDIPYELWEQDQEKELQMEAEFDEWLTIACKHEYMRLADEYLSNNAGMEAFRYLINALGGCNTFPTLTKYLPLANGGILPSSAAQSALNELLLLEDEHNTEEIIKITESETKNTIASVNCNTYNIFTYLRHDNKRHRYGLDKDGFFIIERELEYDNEVYHIMFHSKNFIQKKIGKEVYTFIDVVSGRKFTSGAELYPKEEEATRDYKFTVKTERVKIRDRYRFVIEPLMRLLKASIASGNPIHWC